jgi:hypothetical protein
MQLKQTNSYALIKWCPAVLIQLVYGGDHQYIIILLRELWQCEALRALRAMPMSPWSELSPAN